MRIHHEPAAAILLLSVLVLSACGERRAEVSSESAPPTVLERPAETASPAETEGVRPGDRDSGGDSIQVWFSRAEEPVAVRRAVESAGPEAALQALMAGPTAEERGRGISSWFSDSTAGAVGAVEDRDGFLVVDLQRLDRLVPGASSSAGSARLLESLDSTVFQFPGVDSVEYRLNGSCAAFWEWLQRGCMVVHRP